MEKEINSGVREAEDLSLEIFSRVRSLETFSGKKVLIAGEESVQFSREATCKHAFPPVFFLREVAGPRRS